VRARVEYGPDADYGATTPLEDAPGTAHEALLIGIPAEAEVHFRLVEEGEEGAVHGPDQQAWTGALRPNLSSLQRSGSTDHFTATTLLGASWQPTVFDTEGRVVWSMAADVGDGMLFRTRLARDGRSLLYGLDGVVGGHIVQVGWDGEERSRVDALGFSHDFAETEDGALAWLARESGEAGGETVQGDRIVERSAEGVERVVWSAWDSLVPGEVVDGDWTHANVLEYDPDRQVYQVGLRNLSLLLEVDRWSGEVLWSFGGEGARLQVAEGSTAPQLQHGFERVGADELLVFDNGTSERAASAVRRYTLDEAAGSATETWTLAPDPPIYGYALGDVVDLGGGEVLVAWSSAGLLQRVDAAGAVEFSLAAPPGAARGLPGPRPGDGPALRWAAGGASPAAPRRAQSPGPATR
jgi:hypothetical protein